MRAEEGSDSKALNIYIWSDYIAPSTVTNFEKRTGIKVSVSYYDNNEVLETRLLAGHSGFDIVVPTAPFFARQIKAGVYLALDKSKLSNFKNMDLRLMSKVSQFDPDNAHGVPYMWGTFGIGFNEKMIKALMPDAPLDSWRLIFDPAVAAKIAACGINIVDGPSEVMRMVLPYLGLDPNSQDPKDLAAAETALMNIRPYIRNVDTSGYIEALANGDLCAVAGFNGDVLQARSRAKDARNGINLAYAVPKEGSVLWFDMMAIPKDAPNPANAYTFLNYMMEPPVIAEVSNVIHYANSNAAADPLVDLLVRSDPSVYAPADLRDKLPAYSADSAEQTRAVTRMWQRFKTGR